MFVHICKEVHAGCQEGTAGEAYQIWCVSICSCQCKVARQLSIPKRFPA